MRLERFSGARLLIDKDVCQVEGNPTERELAKLAISITLQQRNGGQVTTDFEELEDREDVSTFDVPQETVGFLLGAKGSTLRQMETNHRVFMFFNNDHVRQSKAVRRRPPHAHVIPSLDALAPPAPVREPGIGVSMFAATTTAAQGCRPLCRLCETLPILC